MSFSGKILFFVLLCCGPSSILGKNAFVKAKKSLSWFDSVKNFVEGFTEHEKIWNFPQMGRGKQLCQFHSWENSIFFFE